MPDPSKTALFTNMAPASYEMMTPLVPNGEGRKKFKKKGPVKGPHIFKNYVVRLSINSNFFVRSTLKRKTYNHH